MFSGVPQRTFLTVTDKQEKAICIQEKQAKEFIPAEIRGYRRGWYSKGKLPQDDMPENSLFIRPTYLGLLKDNRYNTTGLLYSVSAEDLISTDEREKGAGYLYETLSKDDLNSFVSKEFTTHKVPSSFSHLRNFFKSS